MSCSRTILAIETSSARCSVALLGQSICDQLVEDAPRRHHQRLLPMLNELLTRHGVALSDVDALAFGRGPGSFTGLRIGIGVVQGLAYGARKPVIPISSLLALAAGARRRQDFAPKQVAAVMDAHMGELFFCWYRFEQERLADAGSEQLLAPQQLSLPDGFEDGAWIVGDAALAYPELPQRLSASSAYCLPEAVDVARLAAEAGPELWCSAESAQPVYLRGAGAWKRIEEQGPR